MSKIPIALQALSVPQAQASASKAHPKFQSQLKATLALTVSGESVVQSLALVNTGKSSVWMVHGQESVRAALALLRRFVTVWMMIVTVSFQPMNSTWTKTAFGFVKVTATIRQPRLHQG